MADRRNNKRKRRRRGQFGFLYKALSLVMILTAILAGCIIFFRVNEVVVSGENRYTADQIIAVTGVKIGDNLLLLNQNEMRRRLVNELPYVHNVSLKPSFPDKLVITVTECVPVAMIRGDDSWWLMDSSCKLLEKARTATGMGHPTVTGLVAAMPLEGAKLSVDLNESTKRESLTQLLPPLEERGLLDKVSDIDMSAISRITLTYDGRIHVILPMVDDFPTKLWALELALEQIQENERGTLDLTRDVGKSWYFQLE